MSDDFEARAWQQAVHQIIPPYAPNCNVNDVARETFIAGARWGRADAERELREPMACEHPKACWHEEMGPAWCSACRELAEQCRRLADRLASLRVQMLNEKYYVIWPSQIDALVRELRGEAAHTKAGGHSDAANRQ